MSPTAEYHFFHGAALSLIVAENRFTSINRASRLGSNCYIVNHDGGLFIKHASNDNSPWLFNFSPENQEDIRNLFNRYTDKTFLALVCGRDGVCLLQYGYYAAAIDENFTEQEFLTVERPLGGGYRVHGAGGQIGRIIRLNEFPGGIFED